MSKQISPYELAEIIVGLLVTPKEFGPLDTPDKHQQFMMDIAQVVAGHCGGFVNGVSKADIEENYMENQYGFPYISVTPTEENTLSKRNVWYCYDLEYDGSTKLNPDQKWEIEIIRKSLQSALANKGLNDGGHVDFNFTKSDWCISDEVYIDKVRDKTGYSLNVSLGNQSSIEFSDQNGDPILGLCIEIDKGVPAIHFDVSGGNSILHAHLVDGGLVLSPSGSHCEFLPAEVSQYTYDSDGSMLIREKPNQPQSS